MDALLDYIARHTRRWKLEEQPINGVDVGFFKVTKQGNPDAATLKRLLADSIEGRNGELFDPLDGATHSYVTLGDTWLSHHNRDLGESNQDIALRLMALTELLGLGKVTLPPVTPGDADSERQQYIAMCKGGVTVQLVERAQAVTPQQHSRIGGKQDHPNIAQHSSGGRGTD